MIQASHRLLSVTPLLFAATVSLGSSAQAASSVLADRTGFFFDTVITISMYDTDDEAILDQCFERMQFFENTLSRTVEGSDVWNINHSEGQPVEVSDETIDILSQALMYCELTDGALDISIEPVSSLWDFHQGEQGVENPVIPSESDIQDALTHVDYTCVQIDGNTVTLSDPLAGIDLGAIAKGYISDQIREVLLENGCSSALINLGGNILAVGSKPDGSVFNVGIRRPFGDSAYDLIQKIAVTDQSVITSGTYERYFILDDVLYHHILSPETGYPVMSELTSVSIATPNGTQGDALSTACFVLGIEKGMELIESLDGVEAMFICEDEELIASSGWTGTN